MDFAIITNVLSVITFCQIAIISGILIITKSNHTLINRLLAALLVCNLLVISKEFALNNWQWHIFYDYHKVLFILFLSGFLSGPLAYLYICAITNKDFKLKPFHALHSLPALLAYF